MKVVELNRMKASKSEIESIDTMINVVSTARRNREAEKDGYMDAQYEEITPVIDDLGWGIGIDWNSVWSGIVVIAMIIIIFVLLTIV